VSRFFTDKRFKRIFNRETSFWREKSITDSFRPIDHLEPALIFSNPSYRSISMLVRRITFISSSIKYHYEIA